MDAEDEGGSGRVQAHRAQLRKLSEKMERLRGRVGELQRAVEKLNTEQANVTDQLERATEAVHRVVGVAETAAHSHSGRPPAEPDVSDRQGRSNGG